jgi:hypothetical protein
MAPVDEDGELIPAAMPDAASAGRELTNETIESS